MRRIGNGIHRWACRAALLFGLVSMALAVAVGVRTAQASEPLRATPPVLDALPEYPDASTPVGEPRSASGSMALRSDPGVIGPLCFDVPDRLRVSVSQSPRDEAPAEEAEGSTPNGRQGTIPSPGYLLDDIQYFAPPGCRLPWEPIVPDERPTGSFLGWVMRVWHRWTPIPPASVRPASPPERAGWSAAKGSQ